jgi:hypothetical protein
VGKATILSSLGAGQYSIRVEFDNAAIDAKLTAITAKLTGITAKLAELATAKAEALAAFNVDSAALNAYINVTPPDDYVANASAINALTGKLYASRLAYDKAAQDEKRAKLQKTALDKEKDYLEKYCPASFDVNAWCVAYNEDLSGAIETIECDYLLERDAITNQVRKDTGFWLPATSQAPATQLQHALATSQHAAWFNLCMAPAMQRHQGRYRIATLTGVNTGDDTCNLTFDGQYDVDRYRSGLIDNLPILPQFESSEPGVDPAQQLNYTGAAIVYPPCNAEVFQTGDRVIVDLHDGVGAPTVVGFYDNPRACTPDPDPDPDTYYSFTALTSSAPFTFAGTRDVAYTSNRTEDYGAQAVYTLVSGTSVRNIGGTGPTITKNITDGWRTGVSITSALNYAENYSGAYTGKQSLPFSGTVAHSATGALSIETRVAGALQHTLTLTNSLAIDRYYEKPAAEGGYSAVSGSYSRTTWTLTKIVYTEEVTGGVTTDSFRYYLTKVVETGGYGLADEEPTLTGVATSATYILLVINGVEQITNLVGTVTPIEDLTVPAAFTGLSSGGFDIAVPGVNVEGVEGREQIADIGSVYNYSDSSSINYAIAGMIFYVPQ